MSGLRNVVALYASAQFGRFLLVGGAAVLIHWLSRFLFNWFVPFGWAIVLAYCVGLAVGYVLNKIYVFPYSDRPVNVEIFLFIVVNLAAFPLVWVVAYVLGEWVLPRWFGREVALAVGHGLAIGFPVFLNFALHKFITFRGA
jgi:energy-coupling factor transport system substrate-specific component